MAVLFCETGILRVEKSYQRTRSMESGFGRQRYLVFKDLGKTVRYEISAHTTMET